MSTTEILSGEAIITVWTDETYDEAKARDNAVIVGRLLESHADMLEALEAAPPCPGTPGHFPTNPRDCHDWFTRYWNWQQTRADAITKARGGAA